MRSSMQAFPNYTELSTVIFKCSLMSDSHFILTISCKFLSLSRYGIISSDWVATVK
jgi:hypothetical protein